MQQPETFKEAMEYLRTLGDIKSGEKSFLGDKSRCRPCALCEVNPYEVADLIIKHVHNENSRARLDERERVFKSIKKHNENHN